MMQHSSSKAFEAFRLQSKSEFEKGQYCDKAWNYGGISFQANDDVGACN